MATLSDKDKLLDADSQKQIQAYKDQWAAANAAGDKAAMDAAQWAHRWKKMVRRWFLTLL